MKVQILNLALSGYRDSEAIIEHAATHNARCLLTEAMELASCLRSKSHRRVLIRTDSVRQIIVALAACEQGKGELWIAPEAISDDFLSRVIEAQQITAILRDRSVIEVSLSPSRNEEQSQSDFSVLMMTSGTTGQPKIARHTLEGLVGRIRAASSSAFGAKWLLTYQPTSFAGLQVILTSLLTNSGVVVAKDRQAASFIEAAYVHQVTHISGTPTFWRSVLLVLGREGHLPHLRQITLGGEAADPATLKRLASRFPGAQITQIYASTEAGALFAVHDGREGFPASWLDGPVEGICLRIREGVLETQSPRSMQGYVSGHPSPYTKDGWLSTGDLVRVEGDRVLFVGRADGKINVGGWKVSPEEVESIFLKVDGVVETRVFGIPSPITGQILAAEIVCAPGEETARVRARLMQYAHSVLEAYQVPRILRIVPEICTSDSGKKNRCT